LVFQPQSAHLRDLVCFFLLNGQAKEGPLLDSARVGLDENEEAQQEALSPAGVFLFGCKLFDTVCFERLKSVSQRTGI